MLQEKAQDRERLLLKFIKIMKVAVAVAPPDPAPPGPAPGGGRPRAGHPALTATSPLSAALTEAQQLQLLPGHPLSTGLGAHPQAGVAEADLRGERPGREPAGAWPREVTVAGVLRSGDLVSVPALPPACRVTGAAHPTLVSLMGFEAGAGVAMWWRPAVCLLLGPVPGSWLHLCPPRPVLLEGLLWARATWPLGLFWEQARLRIGRIVRGKGMGH